MDQEGIREGIQEVPDEPIDLRGVNLEDMDPIELEIMRRFWAEAEIVKFEEPE